MKSAKYYKIVSVKGMTTFNSITYRSERDSVQQMVFAVPFELQREQSRAE